MKKYILLVLFFLPIMCMSQVIGEWKIKTPEYKWDEIYQYYGDELNYEIDYSLEKYIIRESLTEYVDNISVTFYENNKVTIITVDDSYNGIWEEHGNVLDIVILINKNRVYFDVVIDNNIQLTVSSTNKDFIRIEEKYLNNKIKLEKIIF